MHEGQVYVQVRRMGTGNWRYVTRAGLSNYKCDGAVFRDEAAGRKKLDAIRADGFEYRLVNLLGRSIETEKVS